MIYEKAILAAGYARMTDLRLNLPHIIFLCGKHSRLDFPSKTYLNLLLFFRRCCQEYYQVLLYAFYSSLFTIYRSISRLQSPKAFLSLDYVLCFILSFIFLLPPVSLMFRVSFFFYGMCQKKLVVSWVH